MKDEQDKLNLKTSIDKNEIINDKVKHLFDITKEKIKIISDIMNSLGNETTFEITTTGINIIFYDGIGYSEINITSNFFINWEITEEDIFTLDNQLFSKVVNKCDDKIFFYKEENAFLILMSGRKEFRVRLIDANIGGLEVSKEMKEKVSSDKEYFTFAFTIDGQELFKMLNDMLNDEDTITLEFLPKTKFIQISDLNQNGTGSRFYLKPKAVIKGESFKARYKYDLVFNAVKNATSIDSKLNIFVGNHTPIMITSTNINAKIIGLIAPIVENVDDGRE
jgi:hypothetical protein